MAVTGLTHAEALAKLSQVDEAMNHARQLVQSMQDRTTQMTSSSWLGMQSQKFGQRMQQHTEECTAVVNRLTHYVETGRNNINALVNLEAE
jgi:uncharacterized protein YukE